MTGLVVPLEPEQVAALVEPEQFKRLLGIPRGRELEGQVAERAEWARAWYASHGRPYLKARRHPIAEIGPDTVSLRGGPVVSGAALAGHLRRWDAHEMVGIAVTAGSEIDQASEEMWRDGRPDEGYFLERFGVAVVEQLVHSATLFLCRSAEGDDATLTAHLSPGCGSWELEHQRILWDTIFPGGELGPIRLLDSGGLMPKCSVLAAAGLTRRMVTASPLDACRSCDLAGCRFRRAPRRSVS
jgi:hypothetical protein